MHVLLFCCIGTIGRPESGHSCPIKSRRLHRFIADNRDHKPTHASFQKQSQSHRHQFECFDLAVGVDDTDTPLAIPQYEMKERNQLPSHTSTVHPRTTTLAKQPFAISRAVAHQPEWSSLDTPSLCLLQSKICRQAFCSRQPALMHSCEAWSWSMAFWRARSRAFRSQPGARDQCQCQ